MVTRCLKWIYLLHLTSIKFDIHRIYWESKILINNLGTFDVSNLRLHDKDHCSSLENQIVARPAAPASMRDF